jgi:plasmid maintenance system antidote protein VapI
MDWLELLTDAVRAGNRAEVARRLGVSRSAVSLLLAGRYPGKTKRMADRVYAAYGKDVHLCPHLGRPVTEKECTSNAGRMPTSSPAALRQWRICRACEQRRNPTSEEL